MIEECYELFMNRISAIPEENTVPEPFRDYFARTASFIMKIRNLLEQLARKETDKWSLEQWQKSNRELYQDVTGRNYEGSYANPVYGVAKLGETHGRILSFLYTEVRGMIPLAFENRLEEINMLSQLFIEIYNMFEEEELPGYRQVQQAVYWYVSDYCDVTVSRRVREMLDPALSFPRDIVMNRDLEDLRYLYQYGEYVTENELETARHLNEMSQDAIDQMADTYTEGYRIGFVLGNKDLSRKKTVNIRYRLGFERMIRKAILNFKEMGLEPVIFRSPIHTINKRGGSRGGYYGAIPNPQMDYDHRADQAIYLDKPLITRKLEVMRQTYTEKKELAAVHGGPACVETFGETPFAPITNNEAYHLSEKQQKLSVEYDREASQMVNEFIPGEERSFTIIAFPVPEIGPGYREIFDEVVKINTLDYKKYQRIQSTIIQALDQGVAVHIQGTKGNQTDLTVQLWRLKNPRRETIFENCVADVNIPVGEVFTSPVLKGTTGILEVSEVYLNGLQYKNLHIELEDGMVTDYTCSNFPTREENQKYFFENVMHHHKTLPIGEFAIGTNTTAYITARKYKIEDKLPILIAEKTGPHFALGDTCYSWAEDTPVFNPDGKEIVARDNEISVLRKVDLGKAYFGCHTDITIPYEELGHIHVLHGDGTTTPIIENGKFVLPGTEELNIPLEM